MLNQNLEDQWKVRDIYYEGRKYRLYNEKTTYSQFALYLETSYKIHKLIEKYEFSVYHIKTTPKTKLKLKFNSNKKLDIFDADVKKIKFLQANDFYFLYMNIFFELFYSIPHVNNEGAYNYEMLILTAKDFNIENITKHNFNLINIESYNQIKKEKINFDFIKTFFESRYILNNNFLSKSELRYDYSNTHMDESEFIKNHNNGNEKYNLSSFNNASSFKFVKNFNQNIYVQCRFKCLSTHIWDFGYNYFIEHNKFGKNIIYDDLYDSVGTFFSNFNEINNLKVAEIINEEVVFKELEHYVCCLSENYSEQDIMSGGLSKEFVLNGFINLENKEVRVTEEPDSSSINYIP